MGKISVEITRDWLQPSTLTICPPNIIKQPRYCKYTKNLLLFMKTTTMMMKTMTTTTPPPAATPAMTGVFNADWASTVDWSVPV